MSLFLLYLLLLSSSHPNCQPHHAMNYLTTVDPLTTGRLMRCFNCRSCCRVIETLRQHNAHQYRVNLSQLSSTHDIEGLALVHCDQPLCESQQSFAICFLCNIRSTRSSSSTRNYYAPWILKHCRSDLHQQALAVADSHRRTVSDELSENDVGPFDGRDDEESINEHGTPVFFDSTNMSTSSE